MAATLGSVVVQIGADIAQLRTDMTRATAIFSQGTAAMTASVQRVGAALKGLFAGIAVGVGAGGLGAIGKAALDQADALDAMSSRLSLSVEDVTRLQYVASQTGADFDALARGVTKFQLGLAGAGDGAKQVREGLAGLGLDPDQLLGKAPVEQFKTVLTELGKIEDPIQRLGKAGEIFGPKLAGEFQKVITAGPEEFARLMTRADEIGVTWSSGIVKQLDAVGDKFDELGKVISRVLGEMTAGFTSNVGLLGALDAAVKSVDGTFNAIKATLAIVFLTMQGIYETGKELAGLFDRISRGGLGGLADIGRGGAGALGSYLLPQGQAEPAREAAISTLLKGLTTIFGKPQAPLAEQQRQQVIERSAGGAVPLSPMGEFTINGKPGQELMNPTNRLLEELIRVQKTRGTIAIAG